MYLKVIAFLVSGAVYSVIGEEKYTTRYDNIDIDAILQSDRLLSAYINCLLDKGPCTPDAAEMKRNLPDALETGCSKCSIRQKELTKMMVEFLAINRKEQWISLEKKYDPAGTYWRKYTIEKH